MGIVRGDHVRRHGDLFHRNDTYCSRNWRAGHLFLDLLVLFHKAELHVANTDSNCIHTTRDITRLLRGRVSDKSKHGDVPEPFGDVDTICLDILIHLPYGDGGGGTKQEASTRLGLSFSCASQRVLDSVQLHCDCRDQLQI